MYCPQCAAPVDGMKFCRQCGTNVGLVQQVLTGQLSAVPAQPAVPPASAVPPVAVTPELVRGKTDEHSFRGDRRAQRRQQQQMNATPQAPSVATAMQQIFVGLGFLAAALMITRYFPSGIFWGWTMLFPAFGALGEGVSEYWRVREWEQRAAAAQWPKVTTNGIAATSAGTMPPVPSDGLRPAPTTSELELPSAFEPLAAPAPISITEHTTALLEAKRLRAETPRDSA